MSNFQTRVSEFGQCPDAAAAGVASADDGCACDQPRTVGDKLQHTFRIATLGGLAGLGPVATRPNAHAKLISMGHCPS
jgi:hypothetical protein